MLTRHTFPLLQRWNAPVSTVDEVLRLTPRQLRELLGDGTSKTVPMAPMLWVLIKLHEKGSFTHADLRELLDITAKLGGRASSLKTAQVFATDNSLASTKGVWHAEKLSKDFPVPQASGQSLPGGD